MTRNRILMTCAIATLALGLSACSSDDDAAPLAMMAPEVAPEPAPTPAEMLAAAQSRLDAAQEAVDNLAADATSEQVAAAYGELKVAELALTAAVNQLPPTAAEMLTAAQSRFAEAQEAVDNLAADATPQQIAAADIELAEARLALTVAESLPENQPPPPTELQVAQAAAADAAVAAMTAAVNANTSAENAYTARVNIATMQTGKTSGGHASMARDYADKAEAERVKAEMASAAAAAAEDVATVTRAQVNAEDALVAAMAAEVEAAKHAGLAIDATDNELFIDGTVKTVGGTSINANAGKLVETVGSQTKETGLIRDYEPMVGGVPMGQMFNDNTAPIPDTPHIQAVEARPVKLGKTVDSPDDMARLMIVTAYAGTKTVKVYATLADNVVVEGRLGSDGRIQTDGTDTPEDLTNDVFVTLRPAGTYYLATPGTDDTADLLDHDDVVGAKAVPKQVYYHVTAVAVPAMGNELAVPEVRAYVVFDTTTTGGEFTTVNYQGVDIDVVGPTVGGMATMMQVPISIPEATPYKHIHFGVWAGLEAAKDGTQSTLADLGIGFVQNWSDSGLTGDMPNVGSATSYNGNWVAAVQVKDMEGDGAISMKNGTASLGANFDKGTVSAVLTGLATLTGTIAENKFSGDTASNISATELDADADFEGTFNGGFYGTKAAEAAGIFDFAAANDEGENVGGAFRGAFGGAK